MTPAPRVLLTVGTNVAGDAVAGPRRDYTAVAELTHGTTLDAHAVERSFVARAIRSVFGLASAQAWLAFRLRGDYDVIITDGEHVGIPLALLLRCSRSKVKHVTIGHRLSAGKKRPFFRVLRAHRRMDRVVVHSRVQQQFATDELGIGADRVVLIPYQVDADFWAPEVGPEERLVVSAGLEYRDYSTLLRASRGLDAEVVIGAASRWSKHVFADVPPSGNVRVGRFDYTELRRLYARAAIVVVPLEDVDNQAGVTTILEAMAMGKAVVVTQSRGQTEVVEDRRRQARGTMRPRPPSLARALAGTTGPAVEPNGFYVAPKDANALRAAITYLLDHPEERTRLGRAGRQLAERLFSLDGFAERMSSLVRDTVELPPDLAVGRSASYG